MFDPLFSLYSYKYPLTLAYMLQASEYDVMSYLKWLNRTRNFNQVMKRKKFVFTPKSRLIYTFFVFVFILQIIFGLSLIGLGLFDHLTGGVYFGLAALISYPIIWPYLMVIFLLIVKLVIVMPEERKNNLIAADRFQSFQGVKIAVLGSYGKTTMKELLNQVLSESKKTKSTPGNQNVAASHYRFSKTIEGDEDFLIIEFGEGKNGDIQRFSRTIQPTHAIITGLAPVHQDHYKNLDQQASDLLSIKNFVPEKNIYFNGESDDLKAYLVDQQSNLYNQQQVLGWQIGRIECSVDGLRFKMTKNKKAIHVKSALVGRHLVGSLALVAALAENLGLKIDDIERGLSKTKPFQHRMQPYKLNDAIVIDDTYNGNLEGIKAGLNLLKELSFSKKIYVTPGLVDQGKKSNEIHFLIGQLIAEANPNEVVLMRNSTTKAINEGLFSKAFKGKITIEDHPLEFYQNLSLLSAQDTLIMLQNDWPDNYS